MASIHLSIVIPAYNERHRLPSTLQRILEYLEPRGKTFEIIVVDDGSRDDTAQIARAALEPIGERGRVLRQPRNRGKGTSVRRGMLAARGERVLFSDADLSTPIEEIDKLERRLAGGAKVALGSRAVDRNMIEKRQHWLRDRMGRIFNGIVRLMAVRGIHDTQCGFKLFSGDVVEPIFSRQRLERFGFDVEVLAIAQHLGYPIAEVPVRWINNADSRVSLLQGAIAFLDPFRVRLSLMLGRYNARTVAPVAEETLLVDAQNRKAR